MTCIKARVAVAGRHAKGRSTEGATLREEISGIAVQDFRERAVIIK